MVSGDPVPLYLSFRFYTLPLPILPPPFSFYRTVSICDMIPKTMKTKCVERLMFFEIGARRLLEKYLILACTENQGLNNVEGRDGKKAALCKQVLTFNTVFYLTFLGLCCQVALNLQSCHALEFSGTACLETTTEQNLVLCYWKDVCFLLVSAGDRSFCGPGANRVIAA